MQHPDSYMAWVLVSFHVLHVTHLEYELLYTKMQCEQTGMSPWWSLLAQLSWYPYILGGCEKIFQSWLRSFCRDWDDRYVTHENFLEWNYPNIGQDIALTDSRINTESQTKWPSFCKHLQMHFLQ